MTALLENIQLPWPLGSVDLQAFGEFGKTRIEKRKWLQAVNMG